MTKDTEYWKGVLREAQERYNALRIMRDSLDVQREELNNQMAQMEQIIASVTPITSETPMEKIDAFLLENATELGLADAVREILNQSNRHMTPVAIRDSLVASGYDLEPYSNPLASIHGILKRFEESGEVSTASLGNRTSYRIAPSRKGALTQAEERDIQELKKKILAGFRENRRKAQIEKDAEQIRKGFKR